MMNTHLSYHNHAHCQADLITRAEDICRARGSKLTDQRRDILACVAEGHAAVGAYEIIEKMAKNGVRHAPVTIYRALDFLTDHGLVHKIECRNAYVACSHAHPGKPAALLICEKCGIVAEVDAPDMSQTIVRKAKGLGFKPRQTVLELMGTCQSCERAH
jgi:Fur family transcriptional regulator, zinc uptake regulator